MGIEIERKFLVDHRQWEALAKPAGIVMKQGYMVNADDRTIRIRIANERAYITFKGATLGISRSEYEYEIPVNEGYELFELFAITGIEKIRYNINFKNKLWEVDVFEAANTGLIIAEIELTDVDEQFELPPWVIDEVTHEGKYYNSNLSVHPFKNWL